MIRTLIFATLLLAGTTGWADDGFVNLFNGKDLTGWDGNPELWSVEDGTIVGTTKGPGQLKYNQFLIWDGELADFEVRMQFRLEGSNNSGVQYRSQVLKNVGKWSVGGYQADIHANPSYTGMLYDERGRGIVAERGQKVHVKADGKKAVTKLDDPVKAVNLEDWHELTIIARGNHLTHKIDGVTTVEIIDDQESARELSGKLALQVHQGPAMKVQFKNIRLKKLKADAEKAQAAADPQWLWLQDGEKLAQKVYFRKQIRVPGKVTIARLSATCDNVVTVYVDGQKVVDHSDFATLATTDISALINKKTAGGRHVIAVEAENSGEDNPAGLILKLDLESDWRKEPWSVVSDESWQASSKAQKGWRSNSFKAEDWTKPAVVGELGGAPWTAITAATFAEATVLREPTATPIENMKIAKDFQVELLYSVPKEEQGSWVNMCVDPKGRLIVSDQYGVLYRVTPPAIGSDDEIKIENINVDIGEAQGLLWAFDSLYVVVNRGKKYQPGLYRVRDTDGDDQLDEMEQLRKFDGGSGEHGPHAVVLSPDGQSLYIVCGNQTNLPEIDTSRVPRVWDEDNLLPRTYGRGFMKGRRAPGGYICRTDPDGQTWELVATGFRNEFDARFNADGELFTFDADMEWDMNTPWYRPTRVCLVNSGAEFGWRNGSGKWPVYYPDSVPPVVNVGPGSPTGVCFGYGAKFPAKYQDAFFISDWSYGKLYAVHLQPQGSGYTGMLEEFITGTPLPLTDVVINPQDGAMYFAIGGRRVQSGLYRVTYAGSESTESVDHHQQAGADARKIRHELESLHLGDHPDAVAKAWPYLGHSDRLIRFAARIALEHRPIEEWQARALGETNPHSLLTALLGLARQFERTNMGEEDDIDTPVPDWATDPGADVAAERAQVRDKILAALAQLDWSKLSVEQQIEVLRVHTLTFLRIGPPNEADRQALIARFDAVTPANARELNSELAQMLVYLQAPTAAEKVVAMLNESPTQEEQIDLAKTLRHLRTGWTPELQKTYFSWFVKAAGYRGGASFSLFVQHIREDAVKLLTEEEQLALKPILEAKPEGISTPIAAEPRPVVKEWKFEELVPLVQGRLKNRDFDHGRKMFAAANCFACHRFDNQGGAIGPDLTALSGRFSPRDILESVVDPSKVISDQYSAVTIVTVDGKVINGRIVNLAGDSFRINTNMLDPDAQVGVNRKQIDEMFPSKTSMMPTGLLNTLNEDELLDLMAYLLSRGDRNHPMFKSTSGE